MLTTLVDIFANVIPGEKRDFRRRHIVKLVLVSQNLANINNHPVSGSDQISLWHSSYCMQGLRALPHDKKKARRHIFDTADAISCPPMEYTSHITHLYITLEMQHLLHDTRTCIISTTANWLIPRNYPADVHCFAEELLRRIDRAPSMISC